MKTSWIQFFTVLILLWATNYCASASSRSTTIASNNPKHLEEQGIRLLERNKHQESLAFLEKATKLYPRSNRPALGSTYYYYGFALRKLDRKHEAIAAYQKSIQYDGGKSHTYINLGHLHASLGDDPSAVAVYEQGIEKFPDELYLMENLALSYIRLRKHKKAIPLLSKAVVYRNNHPELKDNELWRKRWIDYLSEEHIDR
ncbi:MAG: tetratricopeptide repeat protein [Spirochaetota bacterium]